MSREHMHLLIQRATGRSSGGDFHELNSWYSDFGGVTTEEFLHAASELRILIDAGGADIRSQASMMADWNDLIELAKRSGAMSLPAFAVVGTYDPQGSFRPGKRVLWSGHFSRAEAERVLPLWETHLGRAKDPLTVEENWPVPLYQLRDDGWEGPSR